MATAKRDLTNPRVQGPRLSPDPLGRLVAIAAEIAEREGLLDEDMLHLPSGTEDVERGAQKEGRSA